VGDACAVLVDEGWMTASRVLLRHVADRNTAEAAFAALVGGRPPTTDELGARRALRATAVVKPPELPPWADAGGWTGPGGTGEPAFVREALTLEQPYARVAAFAIGDAPPAVLVEVSESGTPTRVEPAEARRLARALSEAASVVERARRNGSG
jgi:hypothetical protein